MDNIESLQRSIASCESLHTLVKTMKALSAVSIRQYERAVEALEDYTRTVELGLQVALRNAPPSLFHTPRNKPVSQAAIIFGSDHGLCGRFNEDIAALAVNESKGPLSERSVLAVGSLPVPHLQQAGQTVEAELFTPGSATGITATVQEILLQIEQWRSGKPAMEIWLYYNRACDDGGYQPHSQKLYPMQTPALRHWQSQPWPTHQLPLFTMDREALTGSLLQQFYFISLFRACAESLASEHGNRLSAMQSAERNLEDRLNEIRQQYRRSRQEQITDELLDVVSGFEVIGNGPN